MKNSDKVIIELTGWQGKALMALGSDATKRLMLLSVGLDIVLGLKSVVQVIKTVWKGSIEKCQ